MHASDEIFGIYFVFLFVGLIVEIRIISFSPWWHWEAERTVKLESFYSVGGGFLFSATRDNKRGIWVSGPNDAGDMDVSFQC